MTVSTNHRRAQLAAAQNVVADRKLAIGQVLPYALIYAFVAAADQDHALQG